MGVPLVQCKPGHMNISYSAIHQLGIRHNPQTLLLDMQG